MLLVSTRNANLAQPLDRLEVVVEGGVPMVQDILTLSSNVVHIDRYMLAAVRPGGDDFVALHVESLGGGVFRRSLVLGDMATPDAFQLLYQPAGDGVQVEAPDWNAEGTKIAFFESEPDLPREYSVRILDMITREVSTAFSFFGGDYGAINLSWARTSNELLLHIDRQLYRVDLDHVADPENPELGTPLAQGWSAVWSPDDTQIAYWGANGGLFIKTLETNRDQAIRLSAGSGKYPDWRR